MDSQLAKLISSSLKKLNVILGKNQNKTQLRLASLQNTSTADLTSITTREINYPTTKLCFILL